MPASIDRHAPWRLDGVGWVGPTLLHRLRVRLPRHAWGLGRRRQLAPLALLMQAHDFREDGQMVWGVRPASQAAPRSKARRQVRRQAVSDRPGTGKQGTPEREGAHSSAEGQHTPLPRTAQAAAQAANRMQ